MNDNKITLTQKLAYGSGDVACNILMGVIGGVLFFFYTDYVAISPAMIGGILLVSRIFDGFSDFVMGIVIENTKSKYGKARPWLMRMAIPYALGTVALFCVPAQASDLIKGIYVFVTYNIATTICYTAINLPYGTLSSLMTRDQNDRANLSIFRMGMAPIGRMLAVTFTLPLVKLLGNTQMAWIIVMSGWCVVAVLMLLFNFAKCEEKVVVPAQKEEKIPLKNSVLALFKNEYWIATTVLWGMTSVHYSLVGTVLPYYCKYIFENESLYGILYGVETVTLILGAIVCPYLLKKYTKRDISLVGSVIAVIGQGIFMLNPTSVPLAFASTIIRSIGAAPIITLVFAMMADCVEYGQWKTRIRQEGMIFSASGIGSKAGSGLTTVIIGGLLSLSGYISSSSTLVQQPASALQSVSNIYIYGTLGVWAVVTIILVFYKLDKIYDQVMEDLYERESQGVL